MNDNDSKVVPLRLPQVDPDLIETGRTLLSEIQNGRVVNIAAVYLTSDGEIASIFHFDSALEAVGAVDYLKAEALGFLTE